MLTKKWGWIMIFSGLMNFSPNVGRSEGLIRSIWSCSVPCVSKDNPEKLLAFIQVAYCSTTTLSLAMIDSLSPLCQAKTKRIDAKAARSSPTDVASCNSSSNRCSKEGLTPAGFSCSYLCPSEDKIIRKFTVCASTGDEAWSYATLFCKDAIPPDSSYAATAHSCTAEGQTSCE